jgi:hypothetical protein
MFQNVLHDAAVSRMGSAGYLGAVSRSEDGLFLGASTLLVEGISDSSVLEVMACREVAAWSNPSVDHTVWSSRKYKQRQ